MKSRFNLALAAVVAASATFGAAFVSNDANAQGVSFKGKTVSIVVFSPPGAPPDLWFRQIGPYLSKHLPGNPKVRYINKGGGGSVVAANYTYNALKPDGTNIGSFNAPGAAESVRGKRKVQFDTSKMSFIGAQTITRIVGFRGDSGTTDLNSFVNATKKHLVGLQAADTPYYEAFYRIMGIDFQVFSAYPRFRQRLQALRTGEINTTPFAHLTWVQNLSTYTKSDFHAVYQMGYMDGSGEIVPVTVGGMDKVPTGHSIVKKHKPKAVGSRDWKIMTSVAAGQGVAREVWAPPGTDGKFVAAWRKAFVATANDAQYKADHQKAWGVPMSWIPGDVGEPIVKKYLDMNRPGAF